MSRHTLGVLLVAGSALAWSLGAVFGKLADASLWNTALVRAFAAAVLLGIVLVWRDGAASRERVIVTARAAPRAIAGGTVSMLFLVAAMTHTSIANMTVIYATAPFWAAALLYLMQGTIPDRTMLIASAVAVVGVAMIAGGSGASSWIGDLAAIAMTATFVYGAIELRRAPTADVAAYTFIACLLTALIAVPFATPGDLTAAQVGWLILFGLFSSGLGFFLFMAGARMISTTEAGLIGIAEVPLATLWSILLLGVVPGPVAFAGGAIIIAAVVWQQRAAARTADPA